MPMAVNCFLYFVLFSISIYIMLRLFIATDANEPELITILWRAYIHWKLLVADQWLNKNFWPILWTILSWTLSCFTAQDGVIESSMCMNLNQFNKIIHHAIDVPLQLVRKNCNVGSWYDLTDEFKLFPMFNHSQVIDFFDHNQWRLPQYFLMLL